MKLRKVRISTIFLLDMMTESYTTNFKTMKGLPKGCEFHSVIYDGIFGFEIIVRHESFEELKDGDEIPRHPDIELWRL